MLELKMPPQTPLWLCRKPHSAEGSAPSEVWGGTPSYILAGKPPGGLLPPPPAPLLVMALPYTRHYAVPSRLVSGRVR